MQLATCTDKDYFNQLAKIEQFLTVPESIQRSPLIIAEGAKKSVVKHIVKIIEFFLTVTGKSLEQFQIIILAGDLYDRFRTDSLDDIILMFKMARQGEFGRVYRADTMEIMEWIPKYMELKSEEREKLIQQQKNKRIRKERETPEQMSDASYAKFTELQNRLTAITTPKRETFSINKALQSLDGYLETLPEASMKLSDSDLRFEIEKTKNTCREAYEILSLEQERRKQGKK